MQSPSDPLKTPVKTNDSLKLPYPISNFWSAEKDQFKLNLLSDTTLSPLLKKFRPNLGFNTPLTQQAEIFAKSMNINLEASKSISDPVYVNPNTEFSSNGQQNSTEQVCPVSNISVENLKCILSNVSGPTTQQASVQPVEEISDAHQPETFPSATWEETWKQFSLLQNEENQLTEEKRKLATELQSLFEKEQNVLKKRAKLFKDIISKMPRVPLQQEDIDKFSALPETAKPILETNSDLYLQTNSKSIEPAKNFTNTTQQKRKNPALKDDKLVKRFRLTQNENKAKSNSQALNRQHVINTKTPIKSTPRCPTTPAKSTLKESATAGINRVGRELTSQATCGVKNSRPIRPGVKPKTIAVTPSVDEARTKKLESLKKMTLRKTPAPKETVNQVVESRYKNVKSKVVTREPNKTPARVTRSIAASEKRLGSKRLATSAINTNVKATLGSLNVKAKQKKDKLPIKETVEESVQVNLKKKNDKELEIPNNANTQGQKSEMNVVNDNQNNQDDKGHFDILIKQEKNKN